MLNLRFWTVGLMVSVVFPIYADTMLFSDNFESYAAGSNLVGEGGWTGCGSIPIGTSANLPTNVARTDLGSAGCSGALTGFAVADHTFAGSIGADAVTTLSFNADVPNGSHNTGFLLGGGSSSGFGPDIVELFTDEFAPGWELSIHQNNVNVGDLTILGGTGMPVSFKMEIDVPDQVLYVIYDFGGGPQTTASLSLAGDSLNSWNTLSLFGDYRFGLPQGQFDNVSLSQAPAAVPEATSVLLLGTVALLLIPLSRRFRRSSGPPNRAR